MKGNRECSLAGGLEEFLRYEHASLPLRSVALSTRFLLTSEIMKLIATITMLSVLYFAPTQNQTKKEIKPLKGTAPYGVEKRPMPTGLNLEELLPKQVGSYTRTLLEESERRGVTPSSIQVDGASVYATYESAAKEIFVEFAVSSSAQTAQETLIPAAADTIGKFPTDPRLGSIGTEPSYLRVNNKSGTFYAWTRGNYYFSATAKGGLADLDGFMKSFPY